MVRVAKPVFLKPCVYVTWGWCAETLMHLGCLLSSADCRYLMCRGQSQKNLSTWYRPELPCIVVADKINGEATPTSQFSSVSQLCTTLWNLMECSLPGFPVHHQLPELAQTPVHRVGDAIQPSHPLSSSAFNLSQH